MTSPLPLRLLLPLLLVGVVMITLTRPRPAAGSHGTAPVVRDVAPVHVAKTPGRPLQAPSIVALGSDRALLTYIEHQIGSGDRLMCRLLDRDTMHDAVAVHEQPAQILRPVAARNGDGTPQLFWTQLTDLGPRLFTSRQVEGRWTGPVMLDTTPSSTEHRGGAGPANDDDTTGPAFNAVATTTADGELWLAWQQFVVPEDGGRGSYDVHAAAMNGTELGPITRIATWVLSDWDPVIAATREHLWFAWVQSTASDYEVMARSMDLTSRELSATFSVSQDRIADDLHPSIAANAAGDVWLAWDSVYDPTRGRSGIDTEPQREFVEGARLRMARIRDGVVEVVPGNEQGFVDTPVKLSWTGGVPQLIAGHDGTIALAHRVWQGGVDGPSHTYPVYLQSFDGATWSDHIAFTGSGGAPEEVAIATDDESSGVWIAWQQDRRDLHGGLPLSAPPNGEVKQILESRDAYLTGQIGTSEVGVAWQPPASAANPDRAPPWQPLRADEREREHPWADLTDPILQGTTHYELRGPDATYRVYWGDLHRHSSISRCSHGLEPRPSQRYAFGRDLAMYDFYSLTDHSGHISPFQWWQLGKLLDLYQNPTFCTLQGFEWSNPTYGHQNVILRDRLDIIAGTRHPLTRTPELLWRMLPDGDAITIPHHSSLESCATDWQTNDPNYLRLVEVFQAMRGNYEFEDCYRQSRKAGVPGASMQDGLQRGLKFGLIASTDHGNGASYAAVLAEELTRESLFEALYARRTYGATTKGMLVDFRVDGHWMGEEITTDGNPVVELHAIGMDELAEVTVFRNGEIWQRTPQRVFDKNLEHRLELTVEMPDGGPNTAWELGLTVDLGRFVKEEAGLRPDADRSGAVPHWTQPDLRDARFVWPAGFADPLPAIDQRVRIRVRDETTVQVRGNGTERKVSVAELRRTPLHGKTDGVPWTLRCFVNEDKQPARTEGLGTREFRERWVDRDGLAGDSWYYARIVQMEGEMAWSSPVFVTRE